MFVTSSIVGAYCLFAVAWVVLVKRRPGHFVSRRAIVIVSDLGMVHWAEGAGDGRARGWRRDVPGQAGAPHAAAERSGRDVRDARAWRPERPRAGARSVLASRRAAALAAHPGRRGQPGEPAVVARMLDKAGHRADIVVDGREAVMALRGAPYDLVLMDCLMPEMDGFEAARAIRAAEGAMGRHIPIIALTASAMAEDRERCLAAGMDDYLTKPLTKRVLIEAVERWGSLSADAPKAV